MALNKIESGASNFENGFVDDDEHIPILGGSKCEEVDQER